MLHKSTVNNHLFSFCSLAYYSLGFFICKVMLQIWLNTTFITNEKMSFPKNKCDKAAKDKTHFADNFVVELVFKPPIDNPHLKATLTENGVKNYERIIRTQHEITKEEIEANILKVSNYKGKPKLVARDSDKKIDSKDKEDTESEDKEAKGKKSINKKKKKKKERRLSMTDITFKSNHFFSELQDGTTVDPTTNDIKFLSMQAGIPIGPNEQVSRFCSLLHPSPLSHKAAPGKAGSDCFQNAEPECL